MRLTLTISPFSNDSRCATCGHGPDLIRVHWCPYGVTPDGMCAGPARGSDAARGHYHRHCPCGAEWIEAGASSPQGC